MDVVLRKLGRGRNATGRVMATGGGASAAVAPRPGNPGRPGVAPTVTGARVDLTGAGRTAGRQAETHGVVGTLLRPPAAGFSLIVTFPDGKHEYITTPVRRLFRVLGTNTVYVQTANSTYRLEFVSLPESLAKAKSR